MRLNKLPPAPKKDTPLSEHSVPNAHKSPPSGYPSDKTQYADPNNYKYPLSTEKKIRAAIAYFAKSADKTYSKEQQKSVAGRIASAAKKAGIEVSPDWLKRYGLASKKSRVKHAVAMQNPHYVRYQSSLPAMQRAA